MSVESLPTTDTVVKDEINSTITNNEQAEGSTNGVSYPDSATNITGASETPIEGQVAESNNNPYDNNAPISFNKNELEPEALRKVFIGGLSYKTDDQTFREYFSKYGDIDVSN